MAIELRLQQKLTQQLIMTPQLQMAIKLLQLSRLELVDAVRQELEENPALEEVVDVLQEEHIDQAEKTVEQDAAANEVVIEERIKEDMDWSNYIDEYNSPGRVSYESEDKDTPRFESFIAHKKSLGEHLLWQVMMAFTEETEKKIGTQIVGNLNADGYLDIPYEELLRSCDASPQQVEKVLATMQTFDPTGVCARDLKECLLIQARHLGLDKTVVSDVIQNHLHNLENRNYKAICRALKISFENVIVTVNVIKGLEPRPGRQFSDENPQYIIPDIYVYEFEDDFLIVLNDDGMPKLRVNAFYKSAINNKGEKISDNAKEYIQDKMRSAAWLIRSIHQRQKTIYKVMESILKYQREFFKKGIAYLKPMVLRDVAQDIDMHESTISRVTTNKYAYTPQGIFELKYFFNSSINRVHGGAIASASVQDKIRQIIDSEDQKKPYSDDRIAEILAKSNINIARRTVAKYRETLKILPSHKRKQF
ncbi:MAG: RNA polymerase factor sigma-54 [Desulfobacterales bacterium]